MRFVPLHSICRPKQWKTIASSKLRDEGYPVYGANGIIGYHDEFNHEHPTLLITCRGATCGKLNVSKPFSYINGNAMALDDLSGEVDLNFLAYFLAHRGFDDVISGSAQPQITGQGLQKVLIPLPPLEEQKRIAGILDEADQVRKKTQALIDKYDKLAQSLFLDMFGDPVTNPKGWEVKRLGVLCSKIGSGSTPRGGAESYKDSGITLIRSLNVYNDGLKEKGLAFIDDNQASELNHVTVHENDVLFNITGASVCRTCLAPSRFLPARVNQHVAILRAKSEQVLPVFLHSLLTSENSQRFLNAIGEQGGATRQAITKAQLNNLDVIVPPIQKQHDFALRLNEIELGKSSLLSSLDSGETAFNSLLQKAFKGELS